MKRTVMILMAAGLLAARGVAQTTAPLTLKQCIEAGLANNLDVEQRQLVNQGDKAALLQARMNMLPDLNGSASQSFNQGRSIDPYTNTPVTEAFNSSNYSISSSVVLFNGFAIQNNIKRNALVAQASAMEWQQARDNLTINIILSYLQVLSNTDLLEQARNQLAVSADQLHRLEVLNQQGAVRPKDYSDMKGQYASDQVSIVNSQNALETSKISLCRWMNIPYDKNMVLERIEPDVLAAAYGSSPSAIYETAVSQLAIIKAVELRKKAAAKAIQVARGQLFPTLSFGASVSSRYVSGTMQSHYLNTVYSPTSDSALVSGVKYPVYRYEDKFGTPTKIGFHDQLKNNRSTYYGFTLNIPIFNALNQRARLKQAQVNYKIADLTAKTTRTQLSQDIDAAYLNMSAASDRYKSMFDQVNAFNESFRSAGVLFQQGVSNSYEYLTAKNNLDRANINLIIARYDYVLRSKILDYYQGKQLW